MALGAAAKANGMDGRSLLKPQICTALLLENAGSAGQVQRTSSRACTST